MPKGDGRRERTRSCLRAPALSVNARWVEVDPPPPVSDPHTWECLTCKLHWTARGNSLAQTPNGKRPCDHITSSADIAAGPVGPSVHETITRRKLQATGQKVNARWVEQTVDPPLTVSAIQAWACITYGKRWTQQGHSFRPRPQRPSCALDHRR